MGIKKYINNPGLLFLYFGRKGFFNWMSDEKYISILYKIHFGYYPDLSCPKTYNEKTQWMKLFNRKNEYTELVDKYEVRKVIENKLGKEYLIPLLWVGTNFDDIDFQKLPDKFVIKCSHDSGSVKICNDKSVFDIDKARKFINKHLHTNLYWAGREWVYKNAVPRIIIEEFMGNASVYPEDYKFYVFNGKIDCVMVCKGREKGYPKFYFYDLDWNRLNYLKEEPEDEVKKPSTFEKMIEIVNILAEGFPMIRIDLYDVGGQVYFGEYTFFNQSGFDLDITPKTDLYWGNMVDITSIKKENHE